MTELITRYVRQVGRYLPPQDRADIEAELLSQIYDQLEDRYAGSPSAEQVTAVLTELGYPYQMAASYNRDRYLVGPELYPFMLTILRYGWLLIPMIVLFLGIFGMVVAPQPNGLITALIEMAWATVVAISVFSAVVVLIFAVIQHNSAEIAKEIPPFNPLELPKVDDPGTVDRFEVAFGVAFGIMAILFFSYFAQVGGLTLRFNVSHPGDVLPVPMEWLLVLIGVVLGIVSLNLWVLRRNRWQVGSTLLEIMLEIIGTLPLYFAVYRPLITRLLADNPDWVTTLPFLNHAAEFMAIFTAVITLIRQGIKLIRLWQFDNTPSPSFPPHGSG